jgi:phage terminase large subunit GpA-like protein
VLATKTNNLNRGVPPLSSSRLTAYVDVQKKCLFYTVMGWSEDYTGAIIDYGTYPKNTDSHFTLSNLKNTIQKKYPHHTL